MPDLNPASSALIQFPASMHSLELANDGLSSWVPITHVRTGWISGPLVLALPSPGCGKHLGSELTDEDQYFCVSLALSFLVFQTK